MRLGPDSARYWLAAQGRPVARPFNLRWLLPKACGTHVRRWWAVWGASWPMLAVGVFWLASEFGWQRATLAAILTVGLPGVWGPEVCRPVGVDLPSMALGAVAAAAATHGVWWAAVPLVLLAGMVKESAPVWAALWAWNPILLIGLAAPAVAALIRRPELDEITARSDLRRVHDHPIRTALESRRGRWRDAWLWVAPWGATLAGLYAIDIRTAVTLAVAHAQTFVATDFVRLVHTAAGPALAIAAARVIPTPFLIPAAVAHVWWWRRPEVV